VLCLQKPIYPRRLRQDRYSYLLPGFYVPDIEHESVDQHYTRLEYPEVCLLMGDRPVAPLEKLHNTVDASYADNGAADV